MVEFFQQKGVNGPDELPSGYDQYYNTREEHTYENAKDLQEGMNSFQKHIREIDKAGLLVKHVTIGYPAPILRWLTLIDLPGHEDMLQHRNEFLREQCSRVNALFLVHRKSGLQISKQASAFWRKVVHLNPKVYMFITNARFNDADINSDDEIVRASLPCSHQHIAERIIHVESFAPLFLDELREFLQVRLGETDVCRKVEDIKQLVQLDAGSITEAALCHITAPCFTLDKIQSILKYRVSCLGRPSCGGDYFARDLIFAQRQNSILSGLAPGLLRAIGEHYPTTIPANGYEFVFSCPMTFDLLRPWLADFSESPANQSFFTNINSIEGKGMTTKIENMVTNRNCTTLQVLVNQLNEFIAKQHQTFLNSYSEGLRNFLEASALSENARAAIDSFTMEVLQSVENIRIE